jgi:alkanesulfonate monooxygenase SsuD/methylene tetrahydromethanopterin reductase-like flavin-dependent oxidoreductase (luciferase family)
MGEVKFGVCLGDMTMSASECVRLGPRVEAWGYDSIWMADHLVDIDGAVADPYAVFGYLAAVTGRVFMCAAVSDCQRIHPAKMAHMIATLDEISGGRVGLGIGAGEAMSTIPFGLPFEDDPKVRLERLREYIEVVKCLWSSSPDARVSYSGRHYRLTEAWLDQRPRTRPHPPIHVGALGSNAALRIAAELGDGWQPFFSTPGYYTRRLEYLQAHARKCGRDPAAIEPSVWVYLVITENPALQEKLLRDLAVFSLAERGSLKHAGFDLSSLPSRDYHFARLVVSDGGRLDELVRAAATIPLALVREMHAVGSVAEVTAFCRRHIAAGVRHFIINPCLSPDVDRTLSAFASEVMPQLRVP